MKRKAEFWMDHIAAIQREGASIVGYAKQHALAVKSLYYWQRKLKAVSAMAANESRGASFVALRVAEPVALQEPTRCSLMLGSGIRLELPTLPEPSWLAELVRSVQGAR